eukprot:scaffold22492_cov138-Skeletonema_menzelii.AAC.24
MGCPDASSTEAVAEGTAGIQRRFYPIGTPGKPWSDDERKQWKDSRKFHRSYKEEVLDKLDQIKLDNNDAMEVVQYGALSHDSERYPLFAVKSKQWEEDKLTLLVTGGVHGYETSGVQGALLFLQTKAAKYTERVNIVVAPCVSPWAYEHIERWNADLKDPNRSFKKGSETEESAALISFLESLNVKEWACHLDLHETTDTDELEFMPAKHAEAGLAILEKSSQMKVTHIVTDETIIDEPAVSDGIILVPVITLGLCASITGGKCPATTTEVYPDSPRATDAICNDAQVAAIVSGIDYVLEHENNSR